MNTSIAVPEGFNPYYTYINVKDGMMYLTYDDGKGNKQIITDKIKYDGEPLNITLTSGNSSSQQESTFSSINSMMKLMKNKKRRQKNKKSKIIS